MSGKTVCGIQARLSSSRLPWKVLVDLAGEPLIQRVVERVQAAELVDEVYVLTSNDPSDDPLADELERRGIPHRRGSLVDVAQRYEELIEETDPAFLVRVTGDCPLVEPSFIDLQLGALRALDADFVQVAGNEHGAIEGTLGGQAALSTRALRRALSSGDPRDREHVGSFYFRQHRASFRHVEIEVATVYHRPGLRLCVDEPADLELVRRIYEHFDGRSFRTAEALRWLDAHPHVASLNARVEESADNQALRALGLAAAPVVGKWQ